MTRTLLLRPDSPLVFRTGRPFGAAGTVGGGAGYEFPMPSTAAGALRAAWCDATGHVHQPHDKVLMQIQVRGPLRCSVVRGEPTLWMPQPADASYYADGERQLANRVARLQPGSLEAGAGCDMPYGLQPLLQPLQAKFVDGPKWWSLAAMQAWLSQRAPRIDKLAAHKMQGQVAIDHRTHVSIDTGSSLAKDRCLFTSTGLDFTAPAAQAAMEGSDQGLLLWIDAPDETLAAFDHLASRHGRVGADARTAAYVELPGKQPSPCPANLAAELAAVGPGDVVRLYLATPACYLYNGWFPDGLRPADDSSAIRGSLVGLKGWEFELLAASVGRYATHAGAGMRDENGQPAFVPRALRRLVPAGSVYWLRVLAKGDEPLSARWLQSTCRTEYARDGHGLALWGRA